MQESPKFTNRLIDETSPYLLQHAHNPVEWYPWGDEAFEKAKAEDKPVIVSIGYSACHWCHVMEHESFEDERIAAIQNENFVNVKVDMEERPDVDKIYMNFVQMTTGRGGWPMNVFVTPEQLPFFGGTYFPPSPRYGMPSWPQILMSIAEAWRERRDELSRSAVDILGELRRVAIVPGASAVAQTSIESIGGELLAGAFQSFVRSYDARDGGWGGAPKFPQAMSMEFLLRHWKRTGENDALDMVKKTAEKMACGGMYDQLGGGFHRYSVDAVWLVPHFEKMLYDNAQLIRVYLHLYQISRSELGAGASGSAFFRRIAVETLEYIRREMLDPSGGFYSSQDADSEGEEGKFFVWDPEEIIEVLGEADGREFCSAYDITATGNFEGKNILNIKDLNSLAADTLSDGRVSAMKRKLFDEREKRIKPFRDEKVLTAWNGLMLAAFAEAAAILDSREYLEIAKRNADFLIGQLMLKSNGEHGLDEKPSEQPEADRPNSTSGGRLLRTWKDGNAKLNGYIEDYANLADGLIELFQVSGESKYLTEARGLAETMIERFWDEENGGFYFTADDHEQLIVRSKDLFDNATPSGNSVAADVLLKLSKFYGDERFERYAHTALRISLDQALRFPQGFGRTLAALEFAVSPVKEVIVAGGADNELYREVWSAYRPFKISSVLGEAGGTDLPLFEGRSRVNGRPAAYVCENFVCKRPVTEAPELTELLEH
ncbi:MAG TPA: thioredoxin domain-containing protein [Pyrinomonadaceae bacterium]|nr:thioredoxin domain-containing protein [Pyrinomonadaceae bacterium]